MTFHKSLISTFLFLDLGPNTGIVLEFALDRKIDDRRIIKVTKITKDKYANQTVLKRREDIDDQLVAWLREAFMLVEGN